jgi:hypothetical protein
MPKVRKITYLNTCTDKIALGKAYYRTMKETPPEVSKTAIEVLLYLHSVIVIKSYPFKSRTFSKNGFFDYSSYISGVRELANNGYLDRLTIHTYKLNDKGNSFVAGFWMLHGKQVSKLTASK